VRDRRVKRLQGQANLDAFLMCQRQLPKRKAASRAVFMILIPDPLLLQPPERLCRKRKIPGADHNGNDLRKDRMKLSVAAQKKVPSTPKVFLLRRLPRGLRNGVLILVHQRFEYGLPSQPLYPLISTMISTISTLPLRRQARKNIKREKEFIFPVLPRRSGLFLERARMMHLPLHLSGIFPRRLFPRKRTRGMTACDLVQLYLKGNTLAFSRKNVFYSVLTNNCV